MLLDCHRPVTRRRRELSLPQDDWEDSNPAGTAGELADTTTLFMHTPVLLECDVDITSPQVTGRASNTIGCGCVVSE